MQCCADDIRSVLSAAMSHSRLQRAAVEALSSITTGRMEHEPFMDQARIDSLVLYLAKHGQHVRSLALCEPGYGMLLHELPLSLTKLDSLRLSSLLSLQLQPGLGGTQGVLRAGFPLTRLELNRCGLIDGAQGLATALAQLPDLQHLGVASVYDVCGKRTFPADVLSRLTKLTSLQLQQVDCQDGDIISSSDLSAPLQALTRLADLQLSTDCAVTADMLSGGGQLTRLFLSQERFEPRALAGKSQLQHLTLKLCKFAPDGGVAQLLSELQHLTQLTHLDMGGESCRVRVGPSPPPAAYASLTASSRLQHLDFNNNTLPAAAWQYICPLDRTLPHLRYLNIRDVKEADGSLAVPDTSALVSCCPGLQHLRTSMPCSTAQLAPLQRLTGLHTLVVGAAEQDDELEGVQALCQLTGLQELSVWVGRAAESRLLQLTQLTGLTALTFPQDRKYQTLRCNSQVS
jgi:hypothetical protein